MTNLTADMLRVSRAVLADQELTKADIRLYLAIALAGVEPVTLSDLEALVGDHSTTARAAAVLERKGLIERPARGRVQINSSFGARMQQK